MEQLEFLVAQILKKQDQQDEKLEKILIQTTKTNGRVDNLKEFQEWAENNIQGIMATGSETKGRDKMIGLAMGVVITIGTAILVWLFTDHLIK